MEHPLYDVTNFEPLDTHTLHITFDDGHQQLVNFEPILYGEIFGPPRDLAVFRQVRLDAELRNLVWPNGAMLDRGRCTIGRRSRRRWPSARSRGRMCDRWRDV